MITQVQFGNIFNSGGKQVLGGTNTGYDTESLIGGLTDAKRLPAVQLEQQLEQNALKQTALGEFRSILNRFRDASDFLRNPPGVQNESENIFEYRSATLTSNTAIAGNTYLEVTVEPGVEESSYQVEIGSLATHNVKTTAIFSAADLDAQAVDGGGPLNAGTLVLGPNSTNIVLDSGDTIQEVVTKINAVKDQSRVEVSAIKVSENGANDDYVLSFKALDTGTTQNYGDILANNPGLFNVGFDIQLDATDATVTIDGTMVTRSSNEIDDLIDGVTFSLKQTTPLATNIDLDIEPDVEIARSGILNFVDTYNELRIFLSSQTQVGDDGLPTEDAVLASNSTLRNTLTSLTSELSLAVGGLNGDFSRLSDIGITFDDFPGDEETPFTRNILVVDQDTLDGALAANFDEVRQVFEFDYSSDESEVQIFNRSNALDVNDFSLNIDITNGIYQATYDDNGTPTTVDLDAEAIPGGGLLLNGQDGTVLEGLQLIYGNTTDTVANISISQGIGDRIFNSLETILDEDSGAVSVEIDSLGDASVRMEDEITRIDEIVERFRQQLLEKFTALEQALSSINTILQSLDAQANANAA